MEADNVSSSGSADTETHSRSTEEAAPTSSGRDYINNHGQSGFNSQGSCGTAYESESDASVCESNGNFNDLQSLLVGFDLLDEKKRFLLRKHITTLRKATIGRTSRRVKRK